MSHMATNMPDGTSVNRVRKRRQSNVDVDAIHDDPGSGFMAPAQLYATESGRLFHSGKIAIVTVGLPARGKTHISVALLRYLRWLGVKTRAFHLGDYRRAHMGEGNDVPPDYFHVNASPESAALRKTILQKCWMDIYHFFEEEKGQIAIYDAVNPVVKGRKMLEDQFRQRGIQTIFIESYVDDEKIIEENVRNVKISSPDYAGWDADAAVRDYIRRVNVKIPDFETITDSSQSYIKMINAGKRIIVNRCRFGYLPQRMVFYLMNLHIKSRKTYFARAGISAQEDSYRADATLCEAGREYSRRLKGALMKHREQEYKEMVEQGGEDPETPLAVWTSTRRRTVQTAEPFVEAGLKIKQRPQMSQLNPGDTEKLDDEEIRKVYPEDWERHQLDSFHHRYPRGESYHDLAVRMEPIILELEREKNDLIIIAHESVLRVMYGYLMACSTQDIPTLMFPRNEIVEIIPASYNNRAKRIPIPGVKPSGEIV